jgi:hypothetical protein
MEESIICPYCLTDQNNYKCENICNTCNATYCIICNKPFHIINYQTKKGHFKFCNNNNYYIAKY